MHQAGVLIYHYMMHGKTKLKKFVTVFTKNYNNVSLDTALTTVGS